MLSFIAYALATVFLFCAAIGADFGPDRPIEWGMTLIAAGLALAASGYGGPQWPRRSP